MRQFIAYLAVVAVSVVVIPNGLEAQGEESECLVCIFSAGPPVAHFWLGGSSTVCDNPEEQEVNSCGLNSEDEETNEWIIDSGCPNGCEETEEREAEQAALLAAIDRDDYLTVSDFVRSRDWVEFNADRSAIQLLSCGGAVVGHMPVSKEFLTVLE